MVVCSCYQDQSYGSKGITNTRQEVGDYELDSDRDKTPERLSER